MTTVKLLETDNTWNGNFICILQYEYKNSSQTETARFKQEDVFLWEIYHFSAIAIPKSPGGVDASFASYIRWLGWFGIQQDGVYC